jgi:hypothetical protein
LLVDGGLQSLGGPLLICGALQLSAERTQM